MPSRKTRLILWIVAACTVVLGALFVMANRVAHALSALK
jgi:hypothetical protein